MPPSRLSNTRFDQWALVAVALGAVLRLVLFLQRPSLWIDEAMIALNVGRLTPSRLFSPLEWDQVAPVGWMVVEGLLVMALGMHEWPLRLPALLAGIATPWVVWRVARPMVGAEAALVATVLVATNGALIAYANEAKPYAVDALAAIVLLGLAWDVLAAETAAARQRAWRRLAVLGMVATLFSLTAILVLAGIGAVMLGVAVRQRDRGTAATALGVGALWLCAFIPPWLLIYRPAALDPTMRSFWSDAMAALGTPGILGRTRHFVTQMTYLFTAAPSRHAWLFVVAAGVLGAGLLWERGHRRAVVLLVSPFAVLVVGWLTDHVAIGARLSLWTVPSMAIIGGWTIITLSTTSRWARWIAGIVVVLLAGSGAVKGVRRVSPNAGRAMIEGVLAAQPDVVYLSAGSLPQWLVASTDWARPDHARLDAFAALGSSGGPLFHNTLDRRLESVVPDRTDGIVPREILGRPAGMRIEFGGNRDILPITGWGDTEGRRIAAEAHRGIHVLVIFAQPAEQSALFRGLRATNVPIHQCGTERRAWWWYVGATPPTHCTTLFLPDPS